MPNRSAQSRSKIADVVFSVGDPLAMTLLVATVASRRRRVWALPLVFAFLIGLISNLQLLAPFLSSSTVQSLLDDSAIGAVIGHAVFQVVGNLLAVTLAGWSIVMLLRTTSPQIELARRLEKNGDLVGAAETYLQAGDRRRALALFSKARLWSKAAQVALEAGAAQEAAIMLRRAGGRHLAEAARLHRRVGDAKGARRCDLDLAEWLVQEGHYLEAIEAWLRAGEKRRAIRAAGLSLQENRLKPGHPVFTAVQKAAHELGEHPLIALLFELEGAWEDAANTWRIAGEHVKAAEAFRRADRLEEAAIEEERAGRTKEAVRLQLQLFKRLEDQLDAAEVRGGAVCPQVLKLKQQIAGMAEQLTPKLRKLGMVSDLVRILQGVGRVEDAVQLLVDAGQTDRAADLAHEAQHWSLAGKMLEKLRRWGEASDDYELAGDLEDAARCAERAGEDERAHQLYQGLGNIPKAAGCLARLGKLQDGLAALHQGGLIEEAVALLSDSPGPVPDIPNVILDLAEWIKTNATLEEAIACLQRAVLGVALQPNRLGPAVALAQLFKEAGDFELALEHVDRVIQFDYSHTRAQKLKQQIKAGLSGPATTQAATKKVTDKPTGAQPSLNSSVEQRYEIGEQIGQGGMGVVYRARDTRLERDVAVKVLRTTSAEEAARLEREAKVAATLNHQGIATVFDFERGFGGYFIVMEYVPGDPLDKLMRKDKQRISDNLVLLLRELITTVAYAHERNIVHRDLKPGNVILTPDNLVKICDFGIAARLNIEDDQGGGICGTPYYMSPEQIRGEAPTPASDIYSFGATAFHLATGQPPFRRGNVIDAHLNKEPPHPLEIAPDLPPMLCDIILRCLLKKPSDRFSSAVALRDSLLQIEP